LNHRKNIKAEPNRQIPHKFASRLKVVLLSSGCYVVSPTKITKGQDVHKSKGNKLTKPTHVQNLACKQWSKNKRNQIDIFAKLLYHCKQFNLKRQHTSLCKLTGTSHKYKLNNQSFLFWKCLGSWQWKISC